MAFKRNIEITFITRDDLLMQSKKKHLDEITAVDIFNKKMMYQTGTIILLDGPSDSKVLKAREFGYIYNQLSK